MSGTGGGGIIIIGGGGHQQGGQAVTNGSTDPVAKWLSAEDVVALLGACDAAGLTDICDKIKAASGQ